MVIHDSRYEWNNCSDSHLELMEVAGIDVVLQVILFFAKRFVEIEELVSVGNDKEVDFWKQRDD